MRKKQLPSTLAVIVPGGLNTDIIGLGVSDIIGQGELTLGGELRIGPGGKSRNIAQMIANLLGPRRVAMIGRSAKDPFGLWKIPLEALKKTKVDISAVKILDFEQAQKFPGVALIPINTKGINQIYVLPGVNEDFCKEDILEATPLFETAEQNSGLVALTLEMPLATAAAALHEAIRHHLRVVLDPGGANQKTSYSALLNEHLFFIKPNEHEAKILTGITVIDFESAQEAAGRLRKRGIPHILITHGKHGGYFFSGGVSKHIPIPNLPKKATVDETGCGDQTMASLCTSLVQGEELFAACQKAILAGTLQFQRTGVQPLTVKEIAQYEYLLSEVSDTKK